MARTQQPTPSRRQLQAIVAQQPQAHLPVTLEYRSGDPPELAAELTMLRGYIRDAGKTETTHKLPMTPNMMKACIWLGHEKKNRKVMPAKVALISTMMLEGRFRTATPMIFDWDGVFRDGQHRAHATVATGVTLEFKVQFGTNPEDFNFIDAGQRRTASQFLDLADIKRPVDIIAIVRLEHRINHQGAAMDDPAAFERGMEIADELMAKALARGGQLRGSEAAILSSSALAYRLIASESKRAQSLDEFWDRLVIGDRLDTSDAVFKLRRQFKKNRTAKTRKGRQYLTQTRHAAWIIRAWNAWSINQTEVDFRWDDENALPAVQ